MMDQRSAEWFAARLGKVTASRIADVMAKTRSGYAASRANYAWELAIERLTGNPTPSFCNGAMQWGIDKESEARSAYEEHALCKVLEVGFIDHPEIAMAGASPDGLIGADGLLEIKCPNCATHGETLLTGRIDDKYHKQMQFQMACSGRAWCDFASYDPRFPEPMRLFVKRVERDEEAIGEIETEVRAFLIEIDETVARLRAKYEQLEAA